MGVSIGELHELNLCVTSICICNELVEVLTELLAKDYIVLIHGER